MNLNNFGNYIDKKILDRGYNYYTDDHVLSVTQTEDNVYEAEVEGTDTYTVKVELDEENEIIDAVCDCPYDMGEYCKHQAAVFFELKNLKGIPGSDTKKAVKKQNKTTALKHEPHKTRKTPDIKKILSGRTKDELEAFLLDIASQNKEIKQRIILHLGDENTGDEIEHSIKLIRSYIRKNADRDGYVPYGRTGEAVRGAYLVMEKAWTYVQDKRNEKAIDLAFCVIHEMLDLLEGADDSDGDIGGTIGEGFSVLREMAADEELRLAEKDRLFKRLLEESQNKRFDGWPDQKLQLLSYCSHLADDPVLREKLDKRLDTLTRNLDETSWSSRYFAENALMIRYQMIEQYDGREKAQAFLEQNIKYPGFRQMAIENAMGKKDYISVIRLSLDGEEKNKNEYGTLNKWKKYRYQAYKLSGMMDELRGLASEFILSGDYDFYKDLRSTYNTDDWRAVYPTIIAKLEKEKILKRDIYTSILIEEGEKHKLLEYIRRFPPAIIEHYRILIPEYKEEVYALFLLYIEQAAERANDRSGYKNVCAIIRHLKKARGKEQAAKIIKNLQFTYYKRPAFRDELSRV